MFPAPVNRSHWVVWLCYLLAYLCLLTTASSNHLLDSVLSPLLALRGVLVIYLILLITAGKRAQQYLHFAVMSLGTHKLKGTCQLGFDPTSSGVEILLKDMSLFQHGPFQALVKQASHL